MNTYTQKQETTQCVTNSNAASLMDTSLQNTSLQRKADMANSAMQRMAAAPVQAPNIQHIARHAFEAHGYTREEIMQIFNNGRDNARMGTDDNGRVYYNIPEANTPDNNLFVGITPNGIVAHAGPFGNERTAQL